MKKYIALLLAVVLLCGIFTGCGKLKDVAEDVVEQVTAETLFEKHGFSITLPAYSADVSQEETAEVEPYILAAGEIIICAMEQNKDELGVEMTLEEYGDLLISTNQFPTTLAQKDGLYTFTFEEEADDMIYLCIVLETENAFWFVNASCDTGDHEKYESQMWQYLTTVKVTATGERAAADHETAPAQSVVVEDLTVQLPGGYQDVTEEADANMTFVYSLTDSTALMGLREDKSLWEEAIDLDAYAQAVIDNNALSCQVETRDGITCFTFPSADGAFTYLAAVYEGTDAFWLLQAYAYSDVFPQVEEDLWSVLASVSVN